jgi:hypothetical protein
MVELLVEKEFLSRLASVSFFTTAPQPDGGVEKRKGEIRALNLWLCFQRIERV